MADYVPIPLSPEPKPAITRPDEDEAEVGSDRDAYFTCDGWQPGFHARVNNDHSAVNSPADRLKLTMHQQAHVNGRGNKIIIYPFPGDIPPWHLREPMQSTIGPVRAVTMICVSEGEVAAEVWFVRDDARRACRKCESGPSGIGGQPAMKGVVATLIAVDQCRIDDGPKWSVLPIPRGSMLRTEECVAAHQRRMGSGHALGMRLGGHVVMRQKEVVGQRQGSIKTRKRAARRKRASTRAQADHLARRVGMMI